MRFTFRTKLFGIVGIAAFTFMLMILINTLMTRRVEQKISEIQNQYLPIIELGPQFSTKFDSIRRDFQDAVAARDADILEKTKESKDALLELLTENQATIDPAKVAATRIALEEYYAAAYDVSRRLMSGETGENFVDVMADMQSKQARLNTLLKETTMFDRDKLTEAFSAVSKALLTASQWERIMNVSCLILVLAFSLWLSHGVIWSLNSLRKGFERFGQNDFSQPIDVTSNDEFGDLTRQANQMAVYIGELLKEREAQATNLKLINKELETFSYSVAHDLRAPLRSMLGFSQALKEDYDGILPEDAKHLLQRVTAAAHKMGELIDGLLNLSRLTRTGMEKQSVNLSKIAENILNDLKKNDLGRKADIEIAKNIVTKGDPKLLEVVFTNLLGNAWKFTSKKPEAHIEFGMTQKNGQPAYYIKDNGAGFDMLYEDKLFGTFQRLHSANEFEGTGIGLATVQRIVHRHGGHIWAEAAPDQGATFYFTLG